MGRVGRWPSAPPTSIRPFFPSHVILRGVQKWCTVTVTDAQGRRHSLDIDSASSAYDAAHLYMMAALERRPRSSLPAPTLATVFEVVVDGRLYRVTGKALQQWITERRKELNGPKGALFRQRPTL